MLLMLLMLLLTLIDIIGRFEYQRVSPRVRHRTLRRVTTSEGDIDCCLRYWQAEFIYLARVGNRLV